MDFTKATMMRNNTVTANAVPTVALAMIYKASWDGGNSLPISTVPGVWVKYEEVLFIIPEDVLMSNSTYKNRHYIHIN